MTFYGNHISVWYMIYAEMNFCYVTKVNNRDSLIGPSVNPGSENALSMHMKKKRSSAYQTTHIYNEMEFCWGTLSDLSP